MKLIIFCHPSRNSHSGRALERLIVRLDSRKEKYEVVDLYKDGFDPLLKSEEIGKVKAKEKLCEDVLEMQGKVKNSDTLVFIYPVWWYGAPAMMKGFLDRVFTAGFAFKFKKVPKIFMFAANILSFIPGLRYFLQPYSAQGFLGDKKVVIIRTYGGPALGARVFGNTEAQVENSTLRFCGLTKIKKVELFGVDTSKNRPEKEEDFYRKVELSV